MSRGPKFPISMPEGALLKLEILLGSAALCETELALPARGERFHALPTAARNASTIRHRAQSASSVGRSVAGLTEFQECIPNFANELLFGVLNRVFLWNTRSGFVANFCLSFPPRPRRAHRQTNLWSKRVASKSRLSSCVSPCTVRRGLHDCRNVHCFLYSFLLTLGTILSSRRRLNGSRWLGWPQKEKILGIGRNAGISRLAIC